MDESDAIDQVADYAGKRIVWRRGEKILLDADLARLYGVTTARLNEQVKRNAARFPPDFAFRLTSQEFRSLMSQFATSSFSHGGNRRAPMAFTEHGALMAASVLNSEHAIRISIYVLRAFIQLRQTLATHKAPDRTDFRKALHRKGSYDGLTSFNPTMPATMRRMEPIRRRSFGSLKRMMPRMATPTAPMPVQTA